MRSNMMWDTLGRVLAIQQEAANQDAFYNRLVAMRAKREGTFINDRGRRHVKNRYDSIGVTYAFWLEKEPK